MKDSDAPRISGPEGLESLANFARRILAVPKSAIANKMKEPINRPRKRKRRRRSVAK